MLIVTQLAKYLLIILLLLFSLRDYTYFRYRTEEKRRKAEGRQLFDIYVFDILGFGIIFMNTWDMKVALLLAGIFIYMAFTSVFYKVLYPKASILLVNNMLMLLSVGFVMIARINLTQAIKQFIIAAAGTALALLVPVLVRKVKILQRLTWLYAVIGLLALGAVFALATISGGAKLSIEVGGITIQFSEIVKITLVFFPCLQTREGYLEGQRRCGDGRGLHARRPPGPVEGSRNGSGLLHRLSGGPSRGDAESPLYRDRDPRGRSGGSCGLFRVFARAAQGAGVARPVLAL